MEGLLGLDSHALTGYTFLGFLPLLTLGALIFVISATDSKVPAMDPRFKNRLL
jgi:hypothetical protein